MVPRSSDTKSRRGRRSGFGGWEVYGQDQPDMGCEKLCPAAAQATYQMYQTPILGRTPGLPGPQTAIQPRTCQTGCSGPKTAALPADTAKHMANHRHADGHAFLRCNIPLHGGRWVNFSISSSESQSIKHTSSSKCVRTGMRKDSRCDRPLRPALVRFGLPLSSGWSIPLSTLLGACSRQQTTCATAAGRRCRQRLLLLFCMLHPAAAAATLPSHHHPKTSVLAGARWIFTECHGHPCHS